MKKIRANMDRYFDKVDERWQKLPMRKNSINIPFIFL
jgi:hypothetical protein